MFKELSDRHSLTCFLNSLWREWSNYRREAFEDGEALVLPLNVEQSLVFPLQHFSKLGRHRYTGAMYLSTTHTWQSLSFDVVVEKVCGLLQKAWESHPQSTDAFRLRAIASRDVLFEILEKRAEELSDLTSFPFDFIETEQALLIGHNFHPSPKSRDEFSVTDREIYTPEMGGAFALQWISVENSILYRRDAHAFADKNWTMTLAQHDLLTVGPHSDSSTLVPMHPWQWNVLSHHPLIQQYMDEGKIVVTQTSKNTLWKATSSVRAVYDQSAPYMLKFSMSVRLTNSVRHLQHEEIERGLQVTDALASKLGREFEAKHPNFHIIAEPAYMAIRDLEGNPIPETVVVCRENPFQGEEAKNKILLATLLQDPAVGEQNYLAQLRESSNSELSTGDWAKEWFKKYLNCVVTPLMDGQSNYGIMFGAHQQNVILNIENGFPTKAYYRDCQGSGYSELGFSNFADVVDSITRDNGNVLDRTMGNALFSYYLYINSTWNVMASLAAMSTTTEDELLSLLKMHLHRLSLLTPKDGTCYQDMLTSPTVMHKGNFLCSLKNFNENTIENPFVIYTPIPNSIAMASISLTKGFYAELPITL